MAPKVPFKTLAIDVALVILAGGASRRFQGKQKALIDLGGINILQLLLDELQGFFKQVYISVKDEGQKHSMIQAGIKIGEHTSFVKDLPVFPGGTRDDAAIFGIYSVLWSIPETYAFIISCDMPFVNKDVTSILLEQLSNEPDVVIPLWKNGYLEPTLAIYKTLTARVAIEQLLLKKNYQLVEIAKTLQYIVVVSIETIEKGNPGLDCLININTERDLEHARKVYESILQGKK